MRNRDSIFIYGAGERGVELLKNIDVFYRDKILVKGFVDEKKQGVKCNVPIYKIDEILKESIIVISVFNFEIALQIALELKEKGFQKIFWYNIKTTREERIDFFTDQCVDCSKWNEATLYHVEMHVI